jgi:hypothetical protein
MRGEWSSHDACKHAGTRLLSPQLRGTGFSTSFYMTRIPAPLSFDASHDNMDAQITSIHRRFHRIAVTTSQRMLRVAATLAEQSG